MYRLRALLWKSYKSRVRSPYLTTLDLVGPLLITVLYLVVKATLGSFSSARYSSYSSETRAIFRDPVSSPIDIAAELRRHICNKVPIYSESSLTGFADKIASECGLELVSASSKQDLATLLGNSLLKRIAYSKPGEDLNRPSVTGNNGCFSTGGTNDSFYQAAIHLINQRSYKIYMTDLATNTIIHQPYQQTSTYKEIMVPHSDINSGLYLLEICIAQALTPKDDSNQTIKWRIEPYGMDVAPELAPISCMVIQLVAHLCNAISCVLRVSEDRETGIHHYIRLMGVSSGLYWLSQFIMLAIHLAIQSSVIASILAIQVSADVFDPMYDMSLTMRWLLIYSYAMGLCAHAIFFGSLFLKSTHAILAAAIFGAIYSMYPIIFLLQWSSYGFSAFSVIIDLLLLNPVSNYQSLLNVIFAVVKQTNEPFNWQHLPMGIIKGGISNWTIGSLWLLLIIQIFGWLFMTIFVDQLQYCPSWNPIALASSCRFDWFCCLGLPGGDETKKYVSKRTDLRICSMKNLSVMGPKVMVSYTKGDPFKSIEASRKNATIDPTFAKRRGETNYQMKASRSGRSGSREQPLLLDDLIQQHIVWKRTEIKLDNINLEFNINQVTFVLGQTNLKDVLFETLLGLRSFKTGTIDIDSQQYTSNTISSARKHIGYLGERDIYIGDMTIFENLQFFGSLRDPRYSQFDSESQFLLSLLKLTHHKHSEPATLTHRSIRKLALATASCGHTKLLLLVEPTLSLRWRPRCQVLNLLKKYKSIRSIVVDTSDVDEACAFGDKVLLLRQSRVDLNDTSDNLKNKLNCGYWIIFEVKSIANVDRKISSGRASSPNHATKTKNEHPSTELKALDELTQQLFGRDKLGLNFTDAAQDTILYTDKTQLQQSTPTKINKNSPTQLTGNNSKDTMPNQTGSKGSREKEDQKTVALLKVKQTTESHRALCNMLGRFNDGNTLHGFRLRQVNYVSLEDILVLRMARAVYPYLPPDLLLSLEHRTMASPFINQNDQPVVSVRKLNSQFQVPKTNQPMFGSNLSGVVRERLGSRLELLLILSCHFLSILIVALVLYISASKLKIREDLLLPDVTFFRNDRNQLVAAGYSSLSHSDIDEYFQHRVGYYTIEKPRNRRLVAKTRNDIDESSDSKFSGAINHKNKEADSWFISEGIRKSKQLASSLIFHDKATSETTIMFDPDLPYAPISGIDRFIDVMLTGRFRKASKRTSIQKVSISRYTYKQSWYEIIRGYMKRRFYYSFGFCLAEALSMSILVVTCIRHRSESRKIKLRYNYWLDMAIFDMTISLIQVIVYCLLFVLIEELYNWSLVVTLFCFLLLYKLAALPITYLVSMVVETNAIGILCISIIHVSTGWIFYTNLQTLTEWASLGEGYQYIATSVFIRSLPICALIDALITISHVNRIDQLCPLVPVYTQTIKINNMTIDSPKSTVVDLLLDKVRECLENGKTGISTDVFTEGFFGIVWNIILITLFALVLWAILLISEKVFGMLANRISFRTNSMDPLKTVVRSTEPTNSLFKWDKEKDRLVSEYIRCVNEDGYAKKMMANCLYLRIWLKPMTDQSSIDKRLSSLLQPLGTLGLPKNEIHIELKTTLHLFIRLGSEFNQRKFDKIRLIEAYTDYAKQNSDSVAKFAVVDWSPETLYKILLHGHYNTKQF